MFVLSWMFLDHSKKKPEQMLNLSRIRRSYWRQPANTTEEQFFRVSKDLALLHEIQNFFIETQENWQKTENQFRENIHDMRNCGQLLYTRQQMKFSLDTVSSLLSLIYCNVKAYRAAVCVPDEYNERYSLSTFKRRSFVPIT